VDKEKQEIEIKYRESIRKNEQDLSDLALQKKELGEKQSALLAAKKEISSYLNSVHNDLRGKDATGDKRELEELSAQLQHGNRLAEQELEQESKAIEKRRKELERQKEETEAEYRNTQSEQK